INTMFNTATVVGVGCNIHGAGFPRNFVASFSDGGAAGFSDVIMPKFFETARKVMGRRGVEMTQADVDILNHIHEITADLK
ncbi:MAG: glucose-1-phosphate thymidylyltransferase, partial [Muribaculaceae bacterium]|nr:glucose-1-phosphate thymidylyltransferase [Muribaculaceae bacterium]